MRELVEYIVKELVDNYDDCSVEVDDENALITVTVTKDEIGKVIGKQGRIAKAIRTIVKSASRNGKKYFVEIKEAQA